jgi:hypothetical protein
MHVAALPVSSGSTSKIARLRPGWSSPTAKITPSSPRVLSLRGSLSNWWSSPGWPFPLRALGAGPPNQCRWPQAPLGRGSLCSRALSHIARRPSDRIFAVQLPASEAPEFFIELLVASTYRARAKTVPTSSSLIALTFRVDTPWMYISVSAATSRPTKRQGFKAFVIPLRRCRHACRRRLPLARR